MIKSYIQLAKPGIIFGNLITACAGFGLASKGHFNFCLFISMLVGLALVIGAACVFNNYLDRFIDQKMVRTKNRPLASGAVTTTHALIFGAILGVLGVAVLGFFTNLLATLLAICGALLYVMVYSFMKKKSHFATEIGSIAGAIPPVVGYAAITNQLDGAALLLFLILVFWQMPHFFAIALFRLHDYKAAAIPVLPVKKGIRSTKIQMLVYVVVFTLTAMLLTLLGYAGYLFLIVISLLGVAWLWLSFQGFSCKNDTVWAKKMFRFSLVVIMLFSIVLPLDLYLSTGQ